MTRPAAANTRACLRRLKPPAGPHTYVPTLARSLAAKSTTWTRGVCVCVCVCARAPQYRAASWTRGRWPPRRWGPPPRCPATHTHTNARAHTCTPCAHTPRAHTCTPRAHTCTPRAHTNTHMHGRAHTHIHSSVRGLDEVPRWASPLPPRPSRHVARSRCPRPHTHGDPMQQGVSRNSDCSSLQRCKKEAW